MSAFSDPPLSSSHGYTCKIWMAREIERKFLGAKYYAWFAHELMNIYSALDTAVKRKDVNHAKIKDLRAGLLRVISKYVAPLDRELARTLRHELRDAKIEMFHPQLWRLDLSRIDPTRIKTDRATPGWDEQYVADLLEGEFEVIAE